MKFAISIAVHNNLGLTRKCLESVFECSYGMDYQVYVTDNASTDGTAEYLRELEAEHADVTVIHNDENRGFGPPHNNALFVAMDSPAPPEYFVVLNNDLEVCRSWLKDMSAALERDRRNAICGIKGSCCGISKTGVGQPSNNPEYVEGSCLMIRADLARKHGLFSPEFVFAYYEDSDLSLRMRQLGYRITFVPLPIRHQGAATAKIVADVDLKGFYLRNQRVFLDKWKDYLEHRGFGARSIMIVRAGALGDVILTTPVIRALADKYANAEISVVTGFPEVFDQNPYVTHAGKKMLKQKDKYDLFFDLDMAYEREPNLHIVDAYARVCGVADQVAELGRAPEVFPDAKDIEFANDVVSKEDGLWVAIHPGPTAWIGRNWPAERWAEVSEWLLSEGVNVVLVGGKDAYAIPSTVDLRGKTTFHQLAALMRLVDVFAGIDSAPMHLAAVAEIPIVALFGCIDPAYRLSGLNQCGVTAPKAEVGCLGCHHYLPAPRVASECFREKCKVPRCMDLLRVERVLEALKITLEKLG